MGDREYHLTDTNAIEARRIGAMMVGKTIEEVTTLDWGMTFGIRLSFSDGTFFTFHGQYDEATMINIGETD